MSRFALGTRQLTSYGLEPLFRLTFSSSLALPGPVTLGAFTDERGGLERAPVRGKSCELLTYARLPSHPTTLFFPYTRRARHPANSASSLQHSWSVLSDARITTSFNTHGAPCWTFSAQFATCDTVCRAGAIGNAMSASSTCATAAQSNLI